MKKEFYFDSVIQEPWNKNRVNKLIKILGKEWFFGKKILEVGAGHGKCGTMLMELGADVTFTDGREKHVNWLKEEGKKAFVMDNDKPWTIEGFFDLIVHWGLLYHLNNWQDDLRNAFQRSELICLETVVVDESEEVENKQNEGGYDQALNGVGTIMSSSKLENFIKSCGMEFERYDDPELDSGTHYYSWRDNDTLGNFHTRRFYIIRKN